MADNNLGSSEQIDNLNQTFANTISELSSDNSELNVVDSARKNATLSLKREKEVKFENIGIYSKHMTPLTRTKEAIAQIEDYKKMLHQFLDNQSMTATESVIEEENS